MVIIDTGGDRPRVIGEVDLFSARTLVHEGAIYLHESRQYHVDRLDWDEQKAYVRPVDVYYYTQAELSVTLKPLAILARPAHQPPATQHRRSFQRFLSPNRTC